MDALLNNSLLHVWPRIEGLTDLRTPDDAVGRAFTVEAVDRDAVEIATAGGSPIIIRRTAFLAVLRYLVAHGHGASNACEIRSNQTAEHSGPLCMAAREANGNTRVVNYVVPILAALGILGVDGTQPNATWLI
ncbi:hypothetical protein [Bordetella genomosp. 1]|uniref:hypothetical protein n=1 Tax=Bordetella genomosp. 1 TaxID=1395607 RepID=UPI001140BFAE|nr:hypothetical protein [Bordetella genomosp. 1]